MLISIINRIARRTIPAEGTVTPPPPIDKTIQTLFADGRYNAFGNLTPINSSEVFMSFRSGTDHLNNGRIECAKYNATANTWGSRTILFTPAAGEDFRDPRAGSLGDRLMLFTTKYVPANNTAPSMGYYLSTDMTGTSWGSYTALPYPSGTERGITYGHMVESDTPGTYYACAYAVDNALTTYKVFLWKIVYSEGSITDISTIIVYSGSTKCTESTIEKLGGGKFIVISRVDNNNNLKQFTSSDGGNTWSAMQSTDMGNPASSVPCVPWLKMMNGYLYCIYQDRQTGYIRYSKADPNTVFSDPNAWDPANYIDNTIGASSVGYPNMCIVPGFTDRALLIWCDETSSTAAHYQSRVEDFIFN